MKRLAATGVVKDPCRIATKMLGAQDENQRYNDESDNTRQPGTRAHSAIEAGYDSEMRHGPHRISASQRFLIELRIKSFQGES